jgi:hypothetical protein
VIVIHVAVSRGQLAPLLLDPTQLSRIDLVHSRLFQAGWSSRLNLSNLKPSPIPDMSSRFIGRKQQRRK